MTVLLFLFIIICAAETIYIFRSKKEKDHMYAELTKVFNDAVEGNNIDLPYDESVLSALYDRIVRYININNSKLEAAKAEFDAFTQHDATYIFVTNEIGSGGTSENAIQRRFTDLQGWMNQFIASKADEVILSRALC